MRRRLSRRWRTVKWGLLVSCMVILSGWILSQRWSVQYEGRRAFFLIGFGGLVLVVAEQPWQATADGWEINNHPWKTLYLNLAEPGNTFSERAAFLRRLFGFRWPTLRRGLLNVFRGRGATCELPFWLPLLIVLVPTAFLWRRDRRLPGGLCQSCGYDLTGNTSGVCPECGQAM